MKILAGVLAIVCGLCFLFNVSFFLATGNFLFFFAAIMTGAGTIVNVINVLSTDKAITATTIAPSLSKHQPLCPYCGKHQVSGLENCPHCGAAYNE